MGCEHRSVPGCDGIGGAARVGMGNPRSWWVLVGPGHGTRSCCEPGRAASRAVPCHAVPAMPPRAVAGWVLPGFASPRGCWGGGTPARCPPGTTACFLQLVLAFPFPVSLQPLGVFLLKGSLCSIAVVPEAGPSC